MTGSRAWFGLVNQVAYSFAQTEELTLFRDLLKRNRELFWDNNMETLCNINCNISVNNNATNYSITNATNINSHYDSMETFHTNTCDKAINDNAE